MTCPFCQITAGTAPATVVREWPEAIAIVPLGPVTPGHVLVIPRVHVEDATTDPETTAATMRRASELASRPCNLITSCGAEATQTIPHLHIHIVPRRAGDRLPLPWTKPAQQVTGLTIREEAPVRYVPVPMEPRLRERYR